MARARTQQPTHIRADLKWDEQQRQWIASATATTPNGNKKLQAPGSSSTKAMHRLSTLLEEVHEGPFEVEPKVHIPPSKLTEFQEFAKDLALFRELKHRLTKRRVELAIEFDKDFHLPVRVVAPLLGMSPQRLGRVLADYEMGKSYGPIGRPHKTRAGESDDDEE